MLNVYLYNTPSSERHVVNDAEYYNLIASLEDCAIVLVDCKSEINLPLEYFPEMCYISNEPGMIRVSLDNQSLGTYYDNSI